MLIFLFCFIICILVFFVIYLFKQFSTEKSRLYSVKLELSNAKLELEYQKKENEFHKNWLKEQQNLQEVIFKNLSNSVLKEQTEVEKKNLETLLKPFKEDIDKCKNAIDEVNLKTKTEINENIRNMLNISQSVGDKADKLANAFIGDKKMQGNFGELQFKNLLDYYSFRENIDYYEQYLLTDEERKKKYPDFIIQIQPNKWLIVDSKFSLSNYEKYINETNDIEKQKFFERYVEDLKNRIKELGKKEYNILLKQNGKNTCDFVCLFFGSEMAYLSAFSNSKYREEIAKLSAQYKVAIMTSSSFVPVLQMIRYLWNLEKTNNSLEEIKTKLDQWQGKIINFTECFEQIGKNIKTIEKSYNEAVVKLSGKGNMLNIAKDICQKIGVNLIPRNEQGRLLKDELPLIDCKISSPTDNKDS